MVNIVSRQSKQVRNFKSSRVPTTRNRITINDRKEHRKEPSRARSQMKISKSKTGSQAWLRNRVTFFGYISFSILAASHSICWDLLICMQALVFSVSQTTVLFVKPIRSLAQLLSECKQLGDSITGLQAFSFGTFFMYDFFLEPIFALRWLGFLVSESWLTHGCWSSYLSWEAT